MNMNISTEATRDSRGMAGAARQAGALLLSRCAVERLLTLDECITAVEDAFRQHALGKILLVANS
jgi:hypothetical protein